MHGNLFKYMSNKSIYFIITLLTFKILSQNKVISYLVHIMIRIFNNYNK